MKNLNQKQVVDSSTVNGAILIMLQKIETQTGSP